MNNRKMLANPIRVFACLASVMAVSAGCGTASTSAGESTGLVRDATPPLSEAGKALMSAVGSRDVAAASAAIQAGADPSAEYKHWQFKGFWTIGAEVNATPLMAAIYNEDFAMAELLVASGVDPKRPLYASSTHMNWAFHKFRDDKDKGRMTKAFEFLKRHGASFSSSELDSALVHWTERTGGDETDYRLALASSTPDVVADHLTREPGLRAELNKELHNQQIRRNAIREFDRQQAQKQADQVAALERGSHSVRQIGTRVCAHVKDAYMRSNALVAFTERVEGDRLQVRIAGTLHPSTGEFYYQGLPVRVGAITWDDVRNWVSCEDIHLFMQPRIGR